MNYFFRRQSIRFEIAADTEYAEFQNILAGYPIVSERVDDENLKLIFEHVSDVVNWCMIWFRNV